jgi:hypothetical protein
MYSIYDIRKRKGVVEGENGEKDEDCKIGTLVGLDILPCHLPDRQSAAPNLYPVYFRRAASQTVKCAGPLRNGLTRVYSTSLVAGAATNHGNALSNLDIDADKQIP